MFEGQVAIVTGGESGIGAATAIALAQAGAKVTITYYRDADAAAKTLATAPDSMLARQTDVADEAAVEALFAATEARFGPATLLVNAAGRNMSGVMIADMPLAQFDRVMHWILYGPFLTCRRFVQALERADKGGRIVNISSIHERAPRPGGVDYDAAKGGLAQLTAESWDNWHLSTGPIVSIDGADPVMFYNGATHDARWRIGWISFDKDYSRVTGRGLEPLIMPPPAEDRSATDIAFAASAIVEDGLISLYYSLEDRMLWRARVRRYK